LNELVPTDNFRLCPLACQYIFAENRNSRNRKWSKRW